MLLSENQRRINAIATAEELLVRREQQVLIREDVLGRIAWRSGGSMWSSNASSSTHQRAVGGIDNGSWEKEIDRLVAESASRVPPPVSIHAFVKALEDRAVELEVLYTALEKRERALDEERRTLARRMAAVVQKEQYLSRWTETIEASLRQLCEKEDAYASQARRREENESELVLWRQRLRQQDEELQSRERRLAELLRSTRKDATAGERSTKMFSFVSSRNVADKSDATTSNIEDFPINSNWSPLQVPPPVVEGAQLSHTFMCRTYDPRSGIGNDDVKNPSYRRTTPHPNQYRSTPLDVALGNGEAPLGRFVDERSETIFSSNPISSAGVQKTTKGLGFAALPEADLGKYAVREERGVDYDD